MRTSALERFLRYVVIDTRSDDSSTACPSTPGQLELGRLLVTELSALGLADATVDANGYVTATVPATAGLERRAAIGFIAHLDTSPEMSGTGVRPIVHRRYEGGDIALPDDPSAIIRAVDNPELVARTGDDIVTASGTTLLGADDKAGIASIMAAVEQLLRRSARSHMARFAFALPPMKRSDAAPTGSTCRGSNVSPPIRSTAEPVESSSTKVFPLTWRP